MLMILEWPHPQIHNDWNDGHHQWREITPLAYGELKQAPLLYKAEDAFMQRELVNVLPDGIGLHVCCRKANGYCFARLLPSSDWRALEHLALPDTNALTP